MNEILNPWLRPDGVEHIPGQAVIHLYHTSQHFSDMGRFSYYHCRRDRYDVLKENDS